MERPAAPSIRAWKPPIAGIREVLHARFEHAYPPHTHDSWTLLVVDEGAVRYDLDRHEHLADRSMVTVLPPHVVHDGRPARAGSYRKRVIYLEPGVLGEAAIGPAVDAPAVHDPVLHREMEALHEALICIDDALDAETRLALVTERLRAALGVGEPSPIVDRPAEIADGLRAYLDQRLFETVTLATAATELATTPTQLVHAFSATFGISPHAYVVGRRLDAARDRILDGEPLADVAAAVGFYDQAHLTRRFKRFLGVTPGRFARGA